MSDTTIPTNPGARSVAEGPYGKIGKALNELDDRLGVAKGGRTFMDKIFPDHWSFMLGEIALYSFLILLVTGVFLTLYFVPSSAVVVYHGAYKPLDGQRVTEAFESTVNISFAVRGGLLMRQMHHWACDIFVGSTRRAHGARLLHRCVPQAARTELDHRADAVDSGHRQRLPRLLVARRPGLGHRYSHRVLDHLVDALRRAATWRSGSSAATSPVRR